MNFRNFREQVEKNLKQILKNPWVAQDENFPQKLWETYLFAFRKEDNPIFITRTEHDCSCCRHFIKTMGTVFSFKNGKVITAFDGIEGDYDYVAKACQEAVLEISKTACEPYHTKERIYGIKENRNSQGQTFEHFYCEVPVLDSNNKNIFSALKKSLEKISQEDCLTVMELIHDNSLVRGKENEAPLNSFLTCLAHKEEEEWLREHYLQYAFVSSFANSALGTMIQSIAEIGLEKAVERYETMVMGSNYKRSKPVITEKQKQLFLQAIKKEGYAEESFVRIPVQTTDIPLEHRIFTRKEKMPSIFDELPTQSKRMEGKRISLEEFVSMEKENIKIYKPKKSHEVCMFKGLDNIKPITKWKNNFTWSYAQGAMTVEEAVKSVGAKIDAPFRTSLLWNREGQNLSDLDLHLTDGREHIHFANMFGRNFELDHDTRHPKGIAIENIFSTSDKGKTEVSIYVHNFFGNGTGEMEVEIKLFNQKFLYKLPSPNHRAIINIANVEIDFETQTGKIEHLVPVYSEENAGQYVDVELVCFSPNYWEESKGSQHLLFLTDKKTDIAYTFVREQLSDFFAQHKNMTEVLSKKIPNDGIWGYGFPCTIKEQVYLLIDNRPYVLEI